MKKVLFASTALIATAGVAAAEVNFSGYGRFGIGYKENRTTTESVQVVNPTTGQVTTASATRTGPDTILVSRFRLNIDANVETDGGVEFFGRVRLQADENSSNGEANAAGLNGALFSVIYGGLRVDAGNVGGAIDNLPGYYGTEVGLELFAGQYSGVNYDFLAYSSTGSGSNAVHFNYAVGGFSFAASYDQRDATTTTVTLAPGGTGPSTVTVATNDSDRWDIGAAYTFNNFTAALGYAQTKAAPGARKETLTVLTLGAEFGNFSGTLFVADDDVLNAAQNGTAYGVSGAYNVGAATTLQFTYGDGNGSGDTQQYAIGAIYDLGGGASLRGGVGRTKVGGASGSTQADFGAQFNF